MRRRRTTRSKSKIINRRYDTVQEMLDVCDSKHEEACKKNNFNPSHLDGNRDNFFGGSYEEAVKMNSVGWREGSDRVTSLRADLDSAVETAVADNAASIQYDAEGEWVDIGRLAVDDPECCGYFALQGSTGGAKVVKIIANVSVSGSVSHETMFCRGAAVVAATDILESCGYRVQVVLGMGLSKGGSRLDVQATIKEATQPVDTDRLSYVLCHPIFFRRFMFKVMESEGYSPSGCYPDSVRSDEEDAIVLPELLSSRGATKKETISQVVDICRRCGVELEGSYI